MWRNGKLVPATQMDRGLQFGDGHFTTIAIRNRQVVWWDLHWSRLVHASEKLAMALPPRAEVEQLLAEVCREHPQAVVKIIITRGDSNRGYQLPAQPQCNWYLTVSKLPDPSPTHGLHVDIAEFQLAIQPNLAGLKTLNRLEQVMLSHERQRRQLDELLVTDTQGQLIEAVSSNIFWFDGANWHTPDLSGCGIVGIARTQILTSGVLGQVKQVLAHPQELLQAESVFLLNSVLGPRAVAQIAHQPLAQTQLIEAIQQWWDSEN